MVLGGMGTSSRVFFLIIQLPQNVQNRPNYLRQHLLHKWLHPAKASIMFQQKVGVRVEASWPASSIHPINCHIIYRTQIDCSHSLPAFSTFIFILTLSLGHLLVNHDAIDFIQHNAAAEASGQGRRSFASLSSSFTSS